MEWYEPDFANCKPTPGVPAANLQSGILQIARRGWIRDFDTAAEDGWRSTECGAKPLDVRTVWPTMAGRFQCRVAYK